MTKNLSRCHAETVKESEQPVYEWCIAMSVLPSKFIKIALVVFFRPPQTMKNLRCILGNCVKIDFEISNLLIHK